MAEILVVAFVFATVVSSVAVLWGWFEFQEEQRKRRRPRRRK